MTSFTKPPSPGTQYPYVFTFLFSGQHIVWIPLNYHHGLALPNYANEELGPSRVF
ncbi:hypothetical protein SODALDRAFT_331229 [Sodiomyces alkalinus F11]|uniref:Uncharacterized protein n=1 Tax=Sodiomyces alkalinus (strain CBS 110278 / VKM F-3762 / F11) TaxID=1314773 RepID=A0A3N2Q407_SODAK|nr:hypothetical protein SODALDRAFT_331229 [Sodiomyces alkalinus F11]ROT41493.1 hypothetical protein SODALDRAFT_331229 [Sodiomyces alkalinus F11]